MKRSKFVLLTILALVLLPTVVLGQAMHEGELVYPFQYADLDAYTAATGNSIDSWGEAPMLAEKVGGGAAAGRRAPARPTRRRPAAGADR